MKLTDQILATAYSATFAVFEPIRDFLPGAPNLFHLRHHYATEGVPLTTADVESSTGASRQRFSKALKFLQNEGFIDTNDSRYNNIGVRLLPKGHDEGTLLCSVRPVSSSNAYLKLMLNVFQVLDEKWLMNLLGEPVVEIAPNKPLLIDYLSDVIGLCSGKSYNPYTLFPW